MLELKNISKTYNPGTIHQQIVMQDFSLTINQGDFITIIGANGAGKSTLLNLISGHILIDQGRILLEGKDITYTPEQIRSKTIGRLFQDPLQGTAPSLTVLENLTLAYGKGGWLSRLRKQDKDFIVESIKSLKMRLEDHLNQPVGLLSGGQRQALTLLMATIQPPKILLLDEHTAALDPTSQAQILSLTNDIIQKHHLTCLMITHDMKMALEYGNRLILMNGGDVVKDFSYEEKKQLTTSSLLTHFKEAVGKELTTDRIVLSE